MRRWFSAFAIVMGVTFLAPLAGSAEEPWYSVYRGDHRNWMVSLTGGGALIDLTGGGTIDESVGDTDIDFSGTLDLTEIESLWAEIDLQLLGSQHLRFGYTPMGFDASEVLDESIVVDGTTYDVGDLVDSDLELDLYEISFYSEIWITELINIAPVVQVTLADASVSIENQTLAVEEKVDALLPLPYLGLRGEFFPLARLELFAEAKGMTIGSPASIWEVIGGLQVHLTKNLSILGKYRLSDYQVEFSDTEIDLRLGGPYVGATVRF